MVLQMWWKRKQDCANGGTLLLRSFWDYMVGKGHLDPAAVTFMVFEMRKQQKKNLG